MRTNTHTHTPELTTGPAALPPLQGRSAVQAACKPRHFGTRATQQFTITTRGSRPNSGKPAYKLQTTTAVKTKCLFLLHSHIQSTHAYTSTRRQSQTHKAHTQSTHTHTHTKHTYTSTSARVHGKKKRNTSTSTRAHSTHNYTHIHTRTHSPNTYSHTRTHKLTIIYYGIMVLWYYGIMVCRNLNASFEACLMADKHTKTKTYKHTRTHDTYISVHTYTHTYTHTHAAHAHLLSHTHTHTQTHTNIHTHTCTHTYTSRHLQPVSLRSRARRLLIQAFVRAYPWCHAATEASTLAYHLAFLLHAAPAHRPTLHALNMQVARVSAQDMVCVSVCQCARFCRVGQNRIYTLYMTVCMVNSLLKIPYVHRIYL
jgi:hypothetical protein